MILRFCIACPMILERVIAPWNFIIFTQKFKTRQLFIVKRRNQLECDKWPLTLKIRSRSKIKVIQKSEKIPYKQQLQMWSFNFQALKARSRPKIKDTHDSGRLNE